MNDQQLLRYSRHILLNELGISGQEALLEARVLIVGVGGLGSPAALYMAAAGTGTLVLADDDEVDLTNLQRQILHTEARVGQPKAHSGQVALKEINPEVKVELVQTRLEGELLEMQVGQADLVMDCTDNFATRHAINRACVLHRKPLVSGAAIGFNGQVSTYDLRQKDAPCYHCLFPEGEEVQEVRCATMGVLAPLTGVIGSLQAVEAMKLLTGAGTPLSGRLLMVDTLPQNWRTIKFRKDPLCPVCSPIS